MKTGTLYLVVRLDVEFDFFAGQGADSGCGEHGRVVCLVGEVWECGAVGKWEGRAYLMFILAERVLVKRQE